MKIRKEKELEKSKKSKAKEKKKKKHRKDVNFFPVNAFWLVLFFNTCNTCVCIIYMFYAIL